MTQEEEKRLSEELKQNLSDIREFTSDIETLDFNKVSMEFKNLLMNVKTQIKDIISDEINRKPVMEIIYTSIKENKNKDSVINIPDVNYMIHSYKEYYDGLIKFIYDTFKKIDKTDSVGELIKNISILVKKDEDFMEVCTEYKDEKVSEGISNVECSLDVLELIDVFLKDYDELMVFDTRNTDVKKALVILLSRSVSIFVNRITTDIFDTLFAMKRIYINGEENTRECIDEEKFRFVE